MSGISGMSGGGREDRPDRVLAGASQIVGLGYEHPATLFEQGTALLKLGRFAEAEACYRRSLEQWPDNPDALNNLGTALWQLGHADEAEARYQEALRLRPGDFAIVSNLGNALWARGKTEEASDCYREALRLRPDAVEPRINLGVALSDLGNLDEAVECLTQARQHWPESPDVLNNLGIALSRQGKADEALACYDQALRHQPDHAETHRSRALAWLLLGDYARGWPEYEWRWRCRDHLGFTLAQPRWQGEELGGRTILLHAEQGLGDTLQFIRYASLVKRRGGDVLLMCPSALVRLLARCPGVDRVLPGGSPLSEFDVHASLMSLPAILGTTLTTIPADVPYVSADPETIERWGRVLGPSADLKVGITWQGNPQYRSDRWRSFPLAQFTRLAEVPGVRLISLQKGPGTEQLRTIAGQFAVQTLDPQGDDAPGDLLDATAVMSHLDLVIAPDSAIAHLAGAMGIPVWVPLSPAADWRWLTDRPDTPWYPTARLFRQTRAGDWDEVFGRIAEALRCFSKGAGTKSGDMTEPGNPFSSEKTGF